MKIVVSKNKQLKAIQEEFHKWFPYLKLEFYSSSHKFGEGSLKNSLLNNNLAISETPKFHQDGGVINIDESMKVSELEKAFSDTFGLSVQVFRKSNDMWLQTTITDSWTLEKQNQNGREMNIPENLSPEADDYHEQK
jgi:hypothetical protein